MKTRTKLVRYGLPALGVSLGLGAWLALNPAALPDATPVTNVTVQTPQGEDSVTEATDAAPRRAAAARRYDFEFKNQFGPADNDDDAAAFSLVLSAMLVSQPLGTAGAERLQLSELVIRDGETNRVADAAQVAKLRRALELPFTVKLERGRVAELELGFSADAFAEGILRTLAAALQFVEPANPSDSEWSAIEQDSTGEANVSYRKLGPATYVKSKAAYLRVLTEAGLQTPAQAGLNVKINGNTQIERDAAGNLERLRLSESVTTRTGELAFVNQASLSLRFSGAAKAALPKVAAPVQRRTELATLPEREPVDPQQTQREVLGNATLSELTHELHQLPEADVEGHQRVQERITAAVALRRGDARDLERLVAQGNETESSVSLGALADANTPEAQAALRKLATDNDVPPERRDTAVAMLGLAEDPSPESVELARDISTDAEQPSRATATLALGNMANKLRAQADESGDALVQQLIARLNAAQTEDERALALAALGNTGAPELTEVLAPWLGHESPATRANASWALRLVDDEQAFNVLAEKALSDGDSRVRTRAVGALRYRHADRSVPVLANVLERDRDSGVRLEALSTLTQSDSPEVLPIVERVAQNDKDPNVKQQAESMLPTAG
jgi:HEAT repeat protein